MEMGKLTNQMREIKTVWYFKTRENEAGLEKDDRQDGKGENTNTEPKCTYMEMTIPM
jgi:hypothetical protein